MSSPDGSRIWWRSTCCAPQTLPHNVIWIFIDCGVLEESFPGNLTVDEAGVRGDFHIYLPALVGIICLFIGLWGILWAFRVDGHGALPVKESVKIHDGVGITQVIFSLVYNGFCKGCV